MAGLTGSFLRFAVCASPLSAATIAGPDAALRFELILRPSQPLEDRAINTTPLVRDSHRYR